MQSSERFETKSQGMPVPIPKPIGGGCKNESPVGLDVHAVASSIRTPFTGKCSIFSLRCFIAKFSFQEEQTQRSVWSSKGLSGPDSKHLRNPFRVRKRGPAVTFRAASSAGPRRAKKVCTPERSGAKRGARAKKKICLQLIQLHGNRSAED